MLCNFFQYVHFLKSSAFCGLTRNKKKRRGVTRENMINMLEWKEK